MSVPSDPPSDTITGAAPPAVLHGARAVTMRTIRQTQAQLRLAPPNDQPVDPSVHDVAAALGCPTGAVLGVLAATSAARLEDTRGAAAHVRD